MIRRSGGFVLKLIVKQWIGHLWESRFAFSEFLNTHISKLLKLFVYGVKVYILFAVMLWF